MLLPIGELTKEHVRRLASELDLRTAGKPDSQDVCFISKAGGRASFVGDRIPLREGRLMSTSGDDLGAIDALELVTVGQRRGLGLHVVSLPERRYVVEVDLPTWTATVGTLEELLVGTLQIDGVSWSQLPLVAESAVQVQLSAHGRPLAGRWSAGPGPDSGTVVLAEPDAPRRPRPSGRPRRPVPDDDVVLGGGTAA